MITNTIINFKLSFHTVITFKFIFITISVFDSRLFNIFFHILDFTSKYRARGAYQNIKLLFFMFDDFKFNTYEHFKQEECPEALYVQAGPGPHSLRPL